MKTTTIAASALVAILIAGLATAVVANSNHPTDDHRSASALSCRNLTVGEKLTVSGLSGHFLNATNRHIRGNASGTFSFQVSQKYFRGCTLSITGGSFKLGSTTYSVTGGSVILNRGAHSGDGMGTATVGSFLIRVSGLRGNSTSATVGAVGLDFVSGASEFLVYLDSH